MLKQVISVGLLAFLGVSAQAHLADRPDLNPWAAKLQSGGGIPCCDGADATPVIDADWRVNDKGLYQVHIEGTWWDVPESAVVKQPNKYGRTLVWYGKMSNIIFVRCFLPAAGV